MSHARFDVAKLILNAGTEVDAIDQDGLPPLFGAVVNYSSETVRLLLDAGAKVNSAYKDGTTPLHWASGNAGRNLRWYFYPIFQATKLLLDAGAKVDARDDDGATPLHGVTVWNNRADNESADVAKLLIAASANVDAMNKAGWTLLHKAAYFGDAVVVRILLDAGADGSLKNQKGETHSTWPAKDYERPTQPFIGG